MHLLLNEAAANDNVLCFQQSSTFFFITAYWKNGCKNPVSPCWHQPHLQMWLALNRRSCVYFLQHPNGLNLNFGRIKVRHARRRQTDGPHEPVPSVPSVEHLVQAAHVRTGEADISASIRSLIGSVKNTMFSDRRNLQTQMIQKPLLSCDRFWKELLASFRNYRSF